MGALSIPLPNPDKTETMTHTHMSDSRSESSYQAHTDRVTIRELTAEAFLANSRVDVSARPCALIFAFSTWLMENEENGDTTLHFNFQQNVHQTGECKMRDRVNDDCSAIDAAAFYEIAA